MNLDPATDNGTSATVSSGRRAHSLHRAFRFVFHPLADRSEGRDDRRPRPAFGSVRSGWSAPPRELTGAGPPRRRPGYQPSPTPWRSGEGPPRTGPGFASKDLAHAARTIRMIESRHRQAAEAPIPAATGSIPGSARPFSSSVDGREPDARLICPSAPRPSVLLSIRQVRLDIVGSGTSVRKNDENYDRLLDSELTCQASQEPVPPAAVAGSLASFSTGLRGPATRIRPVPDRSVVASK